MPPAKLRRPKYVPKYFRCALGHHEAPGDLAVFDPRQTKRTRDLVCVPCARKWMGLPVEIERKGVGPTYKQETMFDAKGKVLARAKVS